ERARGLAYATDFKVRALAMMFAADNRRHPNALRARFEAYCPPVAAFLRDVRRKDHRRAARLLQNAEATLFVHRICGRLLREHPDAPLLTKHDAVGTTPAHAVAVAGVILDEFAKLGLRPTLKVTGAGLTPIIRQGLGRLSDRIRIEGEK